MNSLRYQVLLIVRSQDFDARLAEVARVYGVEEFSALDRDALSRFVHEEFFAPSKDESYLDNWDGELDDQLAIMRAQVHIILPLALPTLHLCALGAIHRHQAPMKDT